MTFYEIYLRNEGVNFWASMIESTNGEWATRADAEQLEKERNAYRDECMTRGGRELQALCDKEQAAKERDEFDRKCGELCHAYGTKLIELHDAKRDAVEMALLAQEILMRLYQKLMRSRDPKMIEAACQQDRQYQEAQTIVERHEGGKG